jgi:hypothetical protein
LVLSGKISVGAGKSAISGQLAPIENTSISVIMIGQSTLDVLFAMAARFGYDSDGCDIRCGLLPAVVFQSNSPVNVSNRIHQDILKFQKA